jgi:hypothetical protein
MGFLQRIFKSHGPEPSVCPRSEYLDRDYWCDLGDKRIRIAHLAYSYGDIASDHAERVCKGGYKRCPLYLASRMAR